MKYKERLSMSEEIRKERNLEKEVKLAQLRLKADIVETESAISKTQARLEDLKNSPDINFQEVIKAQEQVENYERGLKALKELEKELF